MTGARQVDVAANTPADSACAHRADHAVHGGPDTLGAARFDFSTNANACGPCPSALQALQSTDITLYPDPSYTLLCQRLAAFHDVAVDRIVLAASASEAIFRLTAWAYQQGVRTVHLPAHHYGDYARAAHAWGLQRSTDNAGALCWACEPSSPLGQAHGDWPTQAVRLHVLDRVYEPLRLSGTASFSDAQLAQVWQLFGPNKALGLAGVRAAYVIAPEAFSSRAIGQFSADVAQLQRLAPSWSLGAHGVALLDVWTHADTQAWLATSLTTLCDWKAQQIASLQALGWTCWPSEANFFCARPPQPIDVAYLRQTHGIKLRDTASFGLPGWFRLGVLAPDAQQALIDALRAMPAPATKTGCTV